MLTKNSTPAERAVGCIFAENLESNEAVIKNGGVIEGTYADNGCTFNNTDERITYSGLGRLFDTMDKFSVVIKLDITSRIGSYQTLFSIRETGSSCRFEVGMNQSNSKLYAYASGSGINLSDSEISNGEHTLMYSFDGTNVLFYCDGVLIGTQAFSLGTSRSNVFIGNYSASQYANATIYSVKVFDSALTAQDALNYYNNSTYNYRNEAVLDLPLTAETYDPTNVRFLDVSGNGYHATLGDGSTSTTFPTKLSKKGISLDGGDYLVVNGAGLKFATGDFTLFMMFKSADTSTATIMGTEEAGDDGWRMVMVSGIKIWGSLNATDIKQTEEIDFRTIHSSAIPFNRSDGSSVYIDGKIASNAPSTTGITITSNSDVYIGTRAFDLASDFTGKIYDIKIFPFVLSPIQIADLHINMMKKINNV